MDPEAYLLRLGDRGPRKPTPGTLTRLHRAHLRAVPFENLDICLGVALDPDAPLERLLSPRHDTAMETEAAP